MTLSSTRPTLCSVGETISGRTFRRLRAIGADCSPPALHDHAFALSSSPRRSPNMRPRCCAPCSSDRDEESSHDSYTIVEAALRAEPTYYVCVCNSDEERAARVVEALRVAPRPAIVYVTRPRDAESLNDSLKAAGFCRSGVYAGTTSTARRRAVEFGWRQTAGAATSLDVVVATSASDSESISRMCAP